MKGAIVSVAIAAFLGATAVVASLFDPPAILVVMALYGVVCTVVWRFSNKAYPAIVFGMQCLGFILVMVLPGWTASMFLAGISGARNLTDALTFEGAIGVAIVGLPSAVVGAALLVVASVFVRRRSIRS